MMGRRESGTQTTHNMDQQQQQQQLRDVAEVVFACKLDGCFSSVLESAASMGRSELLGALLQRLGASASQANAPNPQPDISTILTGALLAAAGRGEAQCLKLLLDAFTSSSTSPASIAQLLVDARDGKGLTALCMAVRSGHVECTRLLLEHSPDIQVSTVTTAGWTALMAAANYGHTSCMQLLLAHSSNIQVSTATTAGWTALMVAANRGHTSCMQLLLAHSPDDQVAAVVSNGQSALTKAAEKGHASCLQLLLAHSPDVQLAAVDTAGRSAVTHAALNGRTSCLQLLLAHNLPNAWLDECLRAVCGRLAALDRQQQPSSLLTKERSLAVVACAELLLAKGAALGADATPGDREALRPIARDLAARALVPNMANEAVVGLALAATGERKRQASGDAAGPPRRPRL